jgi:predicted CXXCH cytochrome family protein
VQCPGQQEIILSRHLFLIVIASLTTTLATPVAMAVDDSYVGSSQCESCHAPVYALWKTSHHYQAMLPATAENVLGDFSDQSFSYAGVNSRFYRKDGKFYVETDNAKGDLEAFEITYTFGFHPLQQYLVEFGDGRYQALNIVWDSRSKNDGGQRWIHLYPDDPVDHDDIVHWTGSFQNWNSRCAVCHSTGLEKNYASSTNTYKTTWQEINVACEACHGPASRHLAWAQGNREPKDRGFAFSLQDRGVFGPDKSDNIRTFSRLDGSRPQTQVETCAACHARRGELSDFKAGQPFADQFRLSMVEPGLYFPDGQVRDEDYVYGSFLQSKMHQAGVVCTNCHEPHSGQVRADDNTLCTQCHVSAVFDRQEHHRHAPGSAGSSCVNCHMPVATYMVVDDRHDHSFRVPEPRLTLELGTPNTCNQCHSDHDAQWALEALESWGVSPQIRAVHAPVLNAAWSGQAASFPELLKLASQENGPAILRASEILATQNFPSQEGLAALQQHLGSDEPLVRAAAVHSMDWVPLAQRYAMLRDLITDSAKLVRMAVARQLSSFPVDQLPGSSAPELQALFREYLASMKRNADMPEELMNLALFHSATGDPGGAEKSYRNALKLSPTFTPAMLNLADLYRANGMDNKAEPLLRQVVGLQPESALGQHALGLLLIRQGRLQESVSHLRAAAQSESSDYRYAYVYGVALWESGEQEQATRQLEESLEQFPGNQELVSALGSYYQQLGETEKFQALMEQYGRPN